MAPSEIDQASPAARVHAAWRAHWGIVRYPEGGRFVAGIPAIVMPGHTIWMLLGADGLLYYARLSPGAGGTVAAESARECASLAVGGGVVASLAKPQLHPTAVRSCTPWPEDTKSFLKSANLDQFGRDELAEFVAILDEAIIARMRNLGRKKHGLKSAQDYNRLAGAEPPEGREAACGPRRCQALDSFPLFSAILLRNRHIADALDRGAPLVRSLAVAHGVKECTIRAMSGWIIGDNCKTGSLPTLVAVADLVPPEWLPDNPVGWGALLALVKKMETWGVLPIVAVHPATGPARRELSVAAAARNRIACAFIRRNGPDLGATRVVDGAAHVRDMAQRLAIEVLVPEVLDVVGHDLRMDLGPFVDVIVFWMCATRSPMALLKLSSRHMARILNLGRAARDRLIVGEDDPGWLPFGDDVTSPDGISIVNLTRQADLDEEGRVMGHCVADYGWRCQRGMSRILAARRTNGDGMIERLTTIELHVDARGQVTVPQHHGRGNKRASPEAVKALSFYLDAVRDGSVRTNIAHLALAARERATCRPGSQVGETDLSLAELCDEASGYDWRNDGERACRWVMWQLLLDGGVRRMTIRDWLASISDDVIDAATADRDDECCSAFRSAMDEFRQSGRGLARVA